MHNFKPVKQPRISDAVFHQLKKTILSNDFKAGDKLPPERGLSGQFQVSRVAVREAIVNSLLKLSKNEEHGVSP